MVGPPDSLQLQCSPCRITSQFNGLLYLKFSALMHVGDGYGFQKCHGRGLLHYALPPVLLPQEVDAVQRSFALAAHFIAAPFASVRRGAS